MQIPKKDLPPTYINVFEVCAVGRGHPQLTKEDLMVFFTLSSMYRAVGQKLNDQYYMSDAYQNLLVKQTTWRFERLVHPVQIVEDAVEIIDDEFDEDEFDEDEFDEWDWDYGDAGDDEEED